MNSLAGLGRPSILAALALCVAATVLYAAGALSKRVDLSRAGLRALQMTFAFTALAGAALLSALVTRDFSLAYVANYTSRSLPMLYTVAAWWGGMEGSLLFWTVLLTGFAALACRRALATSERLAPWAGAVLAAVALFFLVVLAVPADPFARLAAVPADGKGLNPLLQSPAMAVHPPLLYMGFVGFSIPFAYALAALFTGKLDEAWLRLTRRWTLFAWSALSIGIVLGGAWAYTELGWGGYWAWDPVENASFMPWLTATAFLHSVVIQEKRRMLKVWNVLLILLTYALAVFGTFLTRSGLLSSIHTFSQGPVGKWFLPFLGALVIGGLAVVAWRYDELRSENRYDSLLSREAAFLLNNVLFVAAAFTVLWGTIYPIVAEFVTGTRFSVGPPFFNTVFTPIGLALIGLTGIGPLISWRAMRSASLWRIARTPLATGVVVAIALGLSGVRSTGALLAFSLCAFTAAAIVGEFARGSRVHRRRDGLDLVGSLARTVARNRRRYGGYIVHLGVVLIVIGFAGSAFRVERQALLGRGESMELGPYTLTYQGLRTWETPEKAINEVVISVDRNGEPLTTLSPQLNVHFAQDQRQSEIAIRTTPVEDLYAVVTSIDRDGDIALRAFVNPLTWWIWAGAAVMLVGMAILLAGVPGAPSTAPVPARRAEPAVLAR